MLKLKLRYFGHLMWRTDSLEKTMMLEKMEGRMRRGWQRIRWLNGIINLMGMSLTKLWELFMDREALRCHSLWGRKVSDTTVQLNWTDSIVYVILSHWSFNLCYSDGWWCGTICYTLIVHLDLLFCEIFLHFLVGLCALFLSVCRSSLYIRY